MKFEDKKNILSQFINQLEEDFNLIAKLANQAKSDATDSESVAENKYDTRGLEASYLAGAQALRAKELQDAIYLYQQLNLSDISKKIKVGSLLQARVNDYENKWFFIVPTKGGMTIEVNGIAITALTTASPLGQKFISKGVKDSVELQTKSKLDEYEILEVL